MRHFASKHAMVVAAVLASSGCGAQVQDQPRPSAETKPRAPDYDATKKSAPPKPLSADAAAPTGEPEKDKEKRANTPPGMDRSGGGPASGAIVDPEGVTRK